MTTTSFTGAINTHGEWESVETLAEITLTAGKKYDIQMLQLGFLKVANAEFTISWITPFGYTHGTDDLYIRTNDDCMFTILEHTEVTE